MNEKQKAKTRIIGLILLRLAYFIPLINNWYIIATIIAKYNPWLGALGGLAGLIISDRIIDKLFYRRIGQYVIDKNKGVELFNGS